MKILKDKIEDVIKKLLENFMPTGDDDNSKLKVSQIYVYVGLSIMRLLQLLRACDTNNLNLTVIFDTIIIYICELGKTVTVDTYCSWAEVSGDVFDKSSVCCLKSLCLG